MGFVVAKDGARDEEFFEYLRLLRKRKVDIARAPRARDPFAGKRWLYVWETQEKANEFFEALIASTQNLGWEVVEAESRGVGPLSPLAFMMIPLGRDRTFGVDSFSRVIIRAIHPESVPCMTYAEIREEDWEEFRKRKGDLPELIRCLAPSLTGLTLRQLEPLGYVVIDNRTRETLLSVPPVDSVQEGAAGAGAAEPSLTGS